MESMNDDVDFLHDVTVIIYIYILFTDSQREMSKSHYVYFIFKLFPSST